MRQFFNERKLFLIDWFLFIDDSVGIIVNGRRDFQGFAKTRFPPKFSLNNAAFVDSGALFLSTRGGKHEKSFSFVERCIALSYFHVAVRILAATMSHHTYFRHPRVQEIQAEMLLGS
jgi:hypothetical protein